MYELYELIRSYVYPKSSRGEYSIHRDSILHESMLNGYEEGIPLRYSLNRSEEPDRDHDRDSDGTITDESDHDPKYPFANAYGGEGAFGSGSYYGALGNNALGNV
jgi:hypothetical protein